jgi:hypothetical protein
LWSDVNIVGISFVLLSKRVWIPRVHNIMMRNEDVCCFSERNNTACAFNENNSSHNPNCPLLECVRMLSKTKIANKHPLTLTFLRSLGSRHDDDDDDDDDEAEAEPLEWLEMAMAGRKGNGKWMDGWCWFVVVDEGMVEVSIVR